MKEYSDSDGEELVKMARKVVTVYLRNDSKIDDDDSSDASEVCKKKKVQSRVKHGKQFMKRRCSQQLRSITPNTKPPKMRPAARAPSSVTCGPKVFPSVQWRGIQKWQQLHNEMFVWSGSAVD